MISGRQALATIEQTIGQARGEEGRLDAALKSAADQMARLRAERMDAFRALARLKLDTMTRDGVVRAHNPAPRSIVGPVGEIHCHFERDELPVFQAPRLVAVSRPSMQPAKHLFPPERAAC